MPSAEKRAEIVRAYRAELATLWNEYDALCRQNGTAVRREEIRGQITHVVLKIYIAE